MPRPAVSEDAEILYARLGAWYDRAEAMGASDDVWYLLEMCEAIMGRLQPIDDVIRDDPDTGDPGWSQALDVRRAPTVDWLAWMAQFVGVRILRGMIYADAQDRIRAIESFARGTRSAILNASRQSLDPDATVYLTERHGSAYRLTVASIPAETPDPDQMDRDAQAAKPGGLIMNTTQIAGDDYDSLWVTHNDYDQIKALYASYNEVLSDPTRQ